MLRLELSGKCSRIRLFYSWIWNKSPLLDNKINIYTISLCTLTGDLHITWNFHKVDEWCDPLPPSPCWRRDWDWERDWLIACLLHYHLLWKGERNSNHLVFQGSDANCQALTPFPSPTLPIGLPCSLVKSNLVDLLHCYESKISSTQRDSFGKTSSQESYAGLSKCSQFAGNSCNVGRLTNPLMQNRQTFWTKRFHLQVSKNNLKQTWVFATHKGLPNGTSSEVSLT